MDRGLYDLAPEELADVAAVPRSLEEALAALDADRAFLLEGGVFGRACWTCGWTWKMSHDVAAVALRPHPHKFELYFDL